MQRLAIHAGPSMMPRRTSARSTVRGAFLIEALVAVVVVSIAASGLFGLVARSITASGDTLIRDEAAQLVAGTLARMATEEPSLLAQRYDATSNAPGYAALAAAAKRLPGVSDGDNLPVVSVTPGPSLASRRVAVTILWQSPAAATAHRAAMTTIVTPR
jgi:Tfp pilus assembly protein PilV